MLFSATFPKATRDLAKTHLAESHVRLRVGRAGSSHENIKQQIVMVDPSRKREALYDLLCSLPPTRTMVFVNSRRTADELDDFLFNKGIPCTAMHADRTQKEREAAMRAFKSGQSPVLVATGVSARGIDVRNVMHVINYDLPSLDYGGIEEYTHRIGKFSNIHCHLNSADTNRSYWSDWSPRPRHLVLHRARRAHRVCSHPDSLGDQARDSGLPAGVCSRGRSSRETEVRGGL